MKLFTSEETNNLIWIKEAIEEILYSHPHAMTTEEFHSKMKLIKHFSEKLMEEHEPILNENSTESKKEQ